MASLGSTGSYVLAAETAGYSFAGLINRILDVAHERYFGIPRHGRIPTPRRNGHAGTRRAVQAVLCADSGRLHGAPRPFRILYILPGQIGRDASMPGVPRAVPCPATASFNLDHGGGQLVEDRIRLLLRRGNHPECRGTAIEADVHDHFTLKAQLRVRDEGALEYRRPGENLSDDLYNREMIRQGSAERHCSHVLPPAIRRKVAPPMTFKGWNSRVVAPGSRWTSCAGVRCARSMSSSWRIEALDHIPHARPATSCAAQRASGKSACRHLSMTPSAAVLRQSRDEQIGGRQVGGQGNVVDIP